MNKVKYLYHGSRKKLISSKIEPKKAIGLGKKLKNKLTAVYATDKKDAAIVMAIISGAKLSSMHFWKGRARGIVYEGWPKREFIYLYLLPSSSFTKIDNWQWVCYESVKPAKVETLKIKDYINIIRKATKKEKEKWFKKHGGEINKLK